MLNECATGWYNAFQMENNVFMQTGMIWLNERVDDDVVWGWSGTAIDTA